MFESLPTLPGAAVRAVQLCAASATGSSLWEILGLSFAFQAPSAPKPGVITAN